MNAVILVGLPASGKSSFARERFLRTHVRVGLDLFKTRHRERRFFELCLETQMPVVVDNTNPTPADRARYVAPAKAAGFRVAAYYFRSVVSECLARDALRPEAERVPLKGVLGVAGKLVRPGAGEGFDARFYVQMATPSCGPLGAAEGNQGFVVQEWDDDL